MAGISCGTGLAAVRPGFPVSRGDLTRLGHRDVSLVSAWRSTPTCRIVLAKAVVRLEDGWRWRAEKRKLALEGVVCMSDTRRREEGQCRLRGRRETCRGCYGLGIPPLLHPFKYSEGMCIVSHIPNSRVSYEVLSPSVACCPELHGLACGLSCRVR